jgi:hypothetical protein
VTRFVAATTITFAPILFGNLIFADRFRSVGSSTTAFGINLLGAILGGVLEYSSVVLGYRGLIFVVAAAYTAAYLARPGSPVNDSSRGGAVEAVRGVGPSG